MKKLIDNIWGVIDRKIALPIAPLVPVIVCIHMAVLSGLSFMRNMEMIDPAFVSAVNLFVLGELFIVAAWLAYRIFYVPKFGTHQERGLSSKRLSLELSHPSSRVTLLSDGTPFFTDRATGNALTSFDCPPTGQCIDATAQPVEGPGLVPELVDALALLPQVFIPKGTLLHHGCDVLSQDTDAERQILGGDRKWTSQSPLLAAEYGFCHPSTTDDPVRKPLLWVSSLSRDIRGLVGSQRELHKLMPARADLPKVFPDVFNQHAKAALGTDVDYIFLDFYNSDTGRYSEILVPNPLDLLGVHNVIELPLAKPESRQFVREQFEIDEREE